MHRRRRLPGGGGCDPFADPGPADPDSQMGMLPQMSIGVGRLSIDADVIDVDAPAADPPHTQFVSLLRAAASVVIDNREEGGILAPHRDLIRPAWRELEVPMVELLYNDAVDEDGLPPPADIGDPQELEAQKDAALMKQPPDLALFVSAQRKLDEIARVARAAAVAAVAPPPRRRRRRTADAGEAPEAEGGMPAGWETALRRVAVAEGIELRAGTSVSVCAEFRSNDQHKALLKEGWKGKVKGIDKDGDALVHFYNLRKSCWVKEVNFSKITADLSQLRSVAELVDVLGDLHQLSVARLRSVCDALGVPTRSFKRKGDYVGAVAAARDAAPPPAPAPPPGGFIYSMGGAVVIDDDADQCGISSCDDDDSSSPLGGRGRAPVRLTVGPRVTTGVFAGGGYASGQSDKSDGEGEGDGEGERRSGGAACGVPATVPPPPATVPVPGTVPTTGVWGAAAFGAAAAPAAPAPGPPPDLTPPPLRAPPVTAPAYGFAYPLQPTPAP